MSASPHDRMVLRLSCCVAIIVAPHLTRTRADEITLQNDTIAAGDTGYIQQGFVNGDIGGAVFDPPCGFFPLRVRRVQVLWNSTSTAPTQVLVHLRAYNAALPNPGVALYSQEGLALTAPRMNEFVVPSLDWLFANGPITLGVEYVTDLEQPVGLNSGHLVADASGCEVGRNVVFDSVTQQWLDLCVLGMNGNIAIRVVVEPLGNYCFGDNDCDSDVDLADFAAFQTCYTGPAGAAPYQCALFDLSGEGSVDFADFEELATGLGGPDVMCVSRGSCCDGFHLSDFLSRQSAGLEALFAAGGGDRGTRFTLVQTIKVITLLALTVSAAWLIGSCWSSACRASLLASFIGQSTNPDEFDEQPRINQALDWLLNSGDDEAFECAVWYDSHNARQSFFFGTVRINHWQDRQGFVASRFLTENRVYVHMDFVTGPDFSPELLGLILYAEWQHLTGSCPNERACEQQLRQFRQRLNLSDLYPEIQHGFSEGSGG